MYIKRSPLGQGNLTFRKRRAAYPVVLVVVYVAVFAASIFAVFNAPKLQPAVNRLVGPPPTATPLPQVVVKAAEDAYHGGDMDSAAQIYAQAAQISPHDLDILTAYSRVLTLDHKMTDAENVADQIIALAPDDPRGYADKARALDWDGKYQDSVVAALKAIELDNNYALGHAYLAEAYTDLGRLRQADDQAQLAIQLDPYNVDARRNYGNLLESYGDYAGAIQQYQQALTLEPNMLDLWYGLARNYRGNNQMDEAISTFNQIASRNANDPNIYVELGKTYFEMREDDAAQENLEQAVALVCKDCPMTDSSVILADPNYTVKTGSLSFFSEPRKLPGNILMSAWNRLGQVYYTRRNYESAIAILEEAIACGERSQCGVTPKDVPIESYYVTASAYFYLDKCTLAEAHAKSALEIYVNTRTANPNIPPDPNVLSTILCVFELCRDSADTPVTYQGDGFTNGFPNGYTEPNCQITRGSVGVGGNPGSASGTATPEPPTPTANPNPGTGASY